MAARGGAELEAAQAMLEASAGKTPLDRFEELRRRYASLDEAAWSASGTGQRARNAANAASLAGE